jgi:hypothetical protein
MLGPLLALSAVANCSSATHDAAVDAGMQEDVAVAPDVGAASDTGGGPSDAGAADAEAAAKAIQGVGSKCLTSCPMNLTCDQFKWKGFCTKSCTSDTDCQGTGDPPVVGVCASDGLCYKACDPTTNPCTRTEWVCEGEAGRTYCNNYYDAMYVKGETGATGDDASAGD